ncbi:MAG: F0F1 ATP synthase subunit epsilon [Alphaproteobacteria bacterium]|nr:F0F1 ATP synthase subunit epsilon [Alphaproteobacteria bacterium]
MADKLNFDLVAPEARVFQGEVDMVVVPGSEGDFGVLAGHAPFMSTIRSGAIAIHDGADVRRTFIHGGFAEVTPAGLTILAEEAIDIADVDPAEVERQLTEAREDLGQARDEDETREAKNRIEKFEALLQTIAH